MFYLNKKKGKTGFMACKFDLAKAFDRVNWEVLCRIMKSHEFGDRFQNYIYSCIYSTSYSILQNGSPVGYIGAQYGIREGDPMSPALCTIFFYLFLGILRKAKAEGRIHRGKNLYSKSSCFSS